MTNVSSAPSAHAKKAKELFLGGYNCAQAVFAAFTDVTGFDAETSAKLASSFGGGMGRLREVCGAFSGALMAAGLILGYSEPGNDEIKTEHYALVQKLAGKFKEKYGTIICRELLKELGVDSTPIPTKRDAKFYAERPCAAIVELAAQIVDDELEERKFKSAAADTNG